MSEGAIGFIGLGVMGEPICRNMLRKSGRPLLIFDLSEAPLARLVAQGAKRAGSVAEVVQSAGIVFLSLPGGPEVEKVVLGENGVLAHGRAEQIVVDLSTAPVDLTRRIAAELAAKGIAFADAPVARTRKAAAEGTLSIMVGAEPALFETVQPLLAMAASDVTHCGGVGCGQVLKILNNMVLFQTVVALSEALAIGEAAGVERKLLFDTLAKGSADSFALRNHGMKVMIPGDFPLNAFPTDYALKDASYALALAAYVEKAAPGAELAYDMLKRTSEAGFGQEYWPVLARLAGRKAGD